MASWSSPAKLSELKLFWETFLCVGRGRRGGEGGWGRRRGEEAGEEEGRRGGEEEGEEEGEEVGEEEGKEEEEMRRREG